MAIYTQDYINYVKEEVEKLSEAYTNAIRNRTENDVKKYNNLLFNFKKKIGIKKAIDALKNEDIELYEESFEPLSLNSLPSPSPSSINSPRSNSSNRPLNTPLSESNNVEYIRPLNTPKTPRSESDNVVYIRPLNTPKTPRSQSNNVVYIRPLNTPRSESNVVENRLQQLSNAYNVAIESKSKNNVNSFNRMLVDFEKNVGIEKAKNTMSKKDIEIYQELLEPLNLPPPSPPKKISKYKDMDNLEFIPFKLEKNSGQALDSIQNKFISDFFSNDQSIDACRGTMEYYKEEPLEKSTGGIWCVDSQQKTHGYVLWNDNAYYYDEDKDEQEIVFKINLLCSRSNVGAILMRYAEECVKKKNPELSKIMLDATRDSLGFYKKLGYKLVYPNSEDNAEILVYKKI
jgi:hypothetical protein